MRSESWALLLLCCMLTGCGRAELPEPTVSPEPAPIVTEAPILEREFQAVDGLVPIGDICDFLGFELELSGENSALIEGRLLEYLPEDGVISFDGRWLYAPEGFNLRDGELWLETEAAKKILGLWKYEDVLIAHRDEAKLLPGGGDYYDLNYPMDMLYWLPQIIHAEALGQPMAGLIGVGNVVMNRMESDKFPDSVTNVIFDREHVIQFEPVENGSIKAQPDERAHIAAYLCLEGYNTVGDSLFFVNPAYGSYWFDTELELTYVIGEHNFYRYKEP